MKRKIKGLLMHTDPFLKTTITPCSFRDDNSSMRELLCVDTLDFIVRSVGRHQVVLILDDEGLLKPNPITLYDEQANQYLVGDILICGLEHGDLCSLDDKALHEVSFLLDMLPCVK